jgi:hypothetical protein
MKTISKVITRERNDIWGKGETLAKNQITIAETIVNELGYDLVTCGNCGTVQFIDNTVEDSKCYQCGFVGESADYPSLFFDGMTITREVKANDKFGTPLEEGDEVVVVDTEGIEDLGVRRGDVTFICEIHSFSENYVEIDTTGSTCNIYSDRLLKLNKTK